MSQQQRPHRMAIPYTVLYHGTVFLRYDPLDIEAAKVIIRWCARRVERTLRRRPSVARFAQTYAAATLQVSPAALAREHNLPEFSFPDNDSNPTNRV